jgi:hypothetical protein
MSDEIQKQPLIDSVPGVLSAETAPVIDEIADTALRPNVVVVPVDPSRVVQIKPEDFKGDPSRVIGHPSNPNNDILQSYVNRD